MNLKYGDKKIIIDKKIILLLYVIIVIISKIVRYTVMKQTLVDTARGFQMLSDILYNKSLHLKISDIGSSLAFNNAAVIFKSINIFKLSTYVQFEIYITILWNLIVMYMILRLKNFQNNTISLFIMATISVLNIFNFTLSKEPIQLLYFLWIYMVLTSNLKNDRLKYLLCIFVIFISVFSYRNYYILFAFFSCVIYILFLVLNNKKKIGLKDIIFIILLIYIVYVVFLFASSILFPSSFKELLWLKSHKELYPAATQIYNVLNNPTSNIFKLSLEYVLLMIRLLIPYELILKGPKYLLFVIYQILITGYLIKAIKNYKNNDMISNYSLYLFISFLLASVTFEPDYGSWVRHESVAFPLMFLIMGLRPKSWKNKNNNKE